MEKQAAMKEIRLDIKSDLVMNLMNYLMAEEGYIFVGNEKEIWLENLAHPTVQLIYINQNSIYNEMQSQILMKQVQRVRSRVKQRYLMLRLNVLILNVDPMKNTSIETDLSYVKVINASTLVELKQNTELIEIYPNLKEYTLSSTISELIMQMQSVSKEKALSLRNLINYQKHPYVMSVFLLLLVAIYLFIQFQPDVIWATAIQFGAKYNPLILAGEVWRLLTPAFVHLDVVHLLLNAVFIYQMGKLVEGYFGWWRTIFIIFVSALIGNLFSFAFIENISFGASTVAFGLIGAILFMCLENRKMFIHLIKGLILPILGFSILWGIIDPSIDIYGHLGGFTGGFLIASIVGTPKQTVYLSRSVLAAATMFFLILGMFTKGTQLTERTDYDSTNAALVAYYLKDEKYDEAVNLINKLHVDLSQYLKTE